MPIATTASVKFTSRSKDLRSADVTGDRVSLDIFEPVPNLHCDLEMIDVVGPDVAAHLLDFEPVDVQVFGTGALHGIADGRFDRIRRCPDDFADSVHAVRHVLLLIADSARLGG